MKIFEPTGPGTPERVKYPIVEVINPGTVAAWLHAHVPYDEYVCAAIGAVFVVALGLLLARMRGHKAES